MVSRRDKAEIEESGPEVCASEEAVEVRGDLARSFETFSTRHVPRPIFPMVRANPPQARLCAKGEFQ